MSKRQARSEMAASRSSSARARSSRAGGAGKSELNAVDLLTEDHKAVQQLFKAFEKIRTDDDADEEKAEIVKEACQALTVHAEIEEDIFYPAARDALGEEGNNLLDEAEVEHATARDLIEQLEDMEVRDALYDAKFVVLSEYVNHHIEEEQERLFPEIRKADLDLGELGRELSDRKRDLMAELAAADIDEDDDEEEDDDNSDEDGPEEDHLDEDDDEDDDDDDRRR